MQDQAIIGRRYLQELKRYRRLLKGGPSTALAECASACHMLAWVLSVDIRHEMNQPPYTAAEMIPEGGE